MDVSHSSNGFLEFIQSSKLRRKFNITSSAKAQEILLFHRSISLGCLTLTISLKYLGQNRKTTIS